jgi:hypothetical protein
MATKTTGKISASTASKAYNQKTIAAIKARNAGIAQPNVQTKPSDQLKALSIANAQPNASATAIKANTTSGGGANSLRDLSIALANNQKVTQQDINTGSLARTGTAENPITANIPNYDALVAAQRKQRETPSPVTTPVSKVDSYYKELLSALKPTTEEEKAQNEQVNLEAQLRNLRQGQGVMDEDIGDQPIALPFISGQRAAVERRYGLQRSDVTNQQQTLQAKLANLQGQRQSAIDVAKVGVDYGKYQDSVGQQEQTNALNAQKYADSLTQQQYENTTGASQYQDKLKQQQIENANAQQRIAIERQNANRLLTEASTGNDVESKQIASFQADASTYVEKLGSGEISWGTAFNAIKAKYPQASNELIDATLGKERYYNVNP